MYTVTMYYSCKGSLFLAMPQGLDPDNSSERYTDISVQVWNREFSIS
jgi:hypothetical protein